MAFLKEFKEFALKGNVMDMAVGVIIGGAFGKIVSSLVNDILMPPIGALIGNTDFSQLRLDISKVRDITSSAVQSVEGIVTQGDAAQAAAAAEPIYWNYGAFIQQCVDFTILALCVFLMVKLMNRLMKKKEAAPAPAPEPPAPSKEELLLTEIRDLLKEQKKYTHDNGPAAIRLPRGSRIFRCMRAGSKQNETQNRKKQLSFCRKLLFLRNINP